jgi:hypothetical protein
MQRRWEVKVVGKYLAHNYSLESYSIYNNITSNFQHLIPHPVFTSNPTYYFLPLIFIPSLYINIRYFRNPNKHLGPKESKDIFSRVQMKLEALWALFYTILHTDSSKAKVRYNNC